MVREIGEELGLHVKSLQYIKSYPYEKKEMLMLGFQAVVFLPNFTHHSFLSRFSHFHNTSNTYMIRRRNIILTQQSNFLIFIHDCHNNASRKHIPQWNLALCAIWNHAFITNFSQFYFLPTIWTILKSHNIPFYRILSKPSCTYFDNKFIYYHFAPLSTILLHNLQKFLSSVHIAIYC